uniref:Uncharacterized protein n=1 Tax=Varanus komodoensis TaxID=61221 RepID=A0A8D2ITA7_VARKO
MMRPGLIPLHICACISSHSDFWIFHSKYSWYICELIFLECSSVSDCQLPKMLGQVCFYKIFWGKLFVYL